MRRLIRDIRNSEFLTFNEVLRLKVGIVSIFLIAFLLLTIPLSSVNEISQNISIIVPLTAAFLALITLVFVFANLNRIGMHASNISILILTIYYSQVTNHFYGYILFFVALTILIFYQDIVAYLFYGIIITSFGVYYVSINGTGIVGINSLNNDISTMIYYIVLIGFFVIFLIQLLLSDFIYEKMNNEWVRMNKVLEKYQAFIFGYLLEMDERNKVTPLWNDEKFQNTIKELAIFTNEFFEDDAKRITEVIDYYFFLHTQDIDEVLKNKNASVIAKRYAIQLEKYLLNRNSELNSILFDFSTLFSRRIDYSPMRYEYYLDKLLPDKIDKLLSLAILYRFLKREVTQFDKWGYIKGKLTHDDILTLFKSKVFREIISYEQLNFFLDNENIFKNNL